MVEGGGVMNVLVIIFLIVVYFPLAVIGRLMEIQGGSATRSGRRRRRRRKRW